MEEKDAVREADRYVTSPAGSAHKWLLLLPTLKYQVEVKTLVLQKRL